MRVSVYIPTYMSVCVSVQAFVISALSLLKLLRCAD